MRQLIVLALVFAQGAHRAGAQEIRFADVSKAAGLVMQPRGQHPNKDIALIRKGFEDLYAAGYFWDIRDVAFLDANGDGYLDIYLLNRTIGRWCRLWLGDGKGGFTEMKPDEFLVTWESEKGRSNIPPIGSHILPFDFRGDGAQDILLSTGDHHGYRFRYLTQPAVKEEKAIARLFGTHHWIDGTTALLADVDNDGIVDFLIGGQRADKRPSALLCGTFPPYERGESGLGRSRLRFEVEPERTSISLPVGPHSIAADFDGDGRVDLLSRGGRVRLLHNLGNRRFADVTEESGLANMPASGPIAVADFNNDGLLDIFCCGSGGMRLYLNQGGGKFKDDTAGSGLTDNGGGSGGTATVADFNNDGLADIVVCDGSATRLFQNLGGGKFKDVTKASGLLETVMSDSATAAGDLDNDGRVDVLLVSADRGPALFRNTTASGNHWLKVKLRGPRGNPEAAGAQVTVYAAGKLGDKKAILGYQEHIVATEFRAPSPLHFGLGPNQKCDVRVAFPGGHTVELRQVAADTTVAAKQ